MLAIVIGCTTTSDPEKLYYAGRLGEAIATADGARKAKYLAMKTFVSGGDYGEAIAVAERAYAAAKDPASQADALTWEGFARYAQAMTSGRDEYRDAADRIERALALRRQVGDQRGIAEAAFYRGLVAERQGDQTSALKMYRESLAIAQRGGFPLEESYAQRHIAFIERDRGDLVSARERLQRSWELREKIGFRVFLPFSILSLAEIDTTLGRFAEAEKEFSRAHEIGKKLGFRRLEVLIDLSWSESLQKQRKRGEAEQVLRRALKTSQEIGYARGVQLAMSRLVAAQR